MRQPNSSHLYHFFNCQSCHVDPSVMIAQSCMAYGPHIEIVYALSNRHGKYVMGKLSGYRDVERNESATIWMKYELLSVLHEIRLVLIALSVRALTHFENPMSGCCFTIERYQKECHVLDTTTDSRDLSNENFSSIIHPTSPIMRDDELGIVWWRAFLLWKVNGWSSHETNVGLAL